MVYGQTELTRDLMQQREATGATTIYDAVNVCPHDFDGCSPYVTYEKAGVTHRIDCDFIAGCDGFHGVSRRSVPEKSITTFEKVYPVRLAWPARRCAAGQSRIDLCQSSPWFRALLDALAKPQPLLSAVCLGRESGGLERSAVLGRTAHPDCPSITPKRLSPGPSFEKSIAPLRSFVAEPLRFGSLSFSLAMRRISSRRRGPRG